MSGSTLRTIPYYGFPIWVREEARAKAPVVILSIRDQTIIYEHPPRVIPALSEYLSSPSSKPILEELPNRCMEQFFAGYLALSETASNEARIRAVDEIRNRSGLTLAVLLTAFRPCLLDSSSVRGGTRKPASIEDDRRAIRTLLEYEGTTPWQEATAKKCTPWLTDLSSSRRRGCVRMMRQLLYQLEKKGVSKDYMGWDTYEPPEGRTNKPSHDLLVQKNILPNTLTYDQLDAFLFHGRDPETLSGTSMSGADIGAILSVFLALIPEEICGINLEDFITLRDYSQRMGVMITKTYEKQPGCKNFRTIPIQDQHRRRLLPLPHRLTKLLASYIDSRVKNEAGATPLITSKASNKRRMTPDDFKNEIDSRLQKLFPPNKETGFRPAYQMLVTTAMRELDKGGLETEELRYLNGKNPESTWAVSYNDFSGENELNKMGSVQDKLMNRVTPTAVTDNSKEKKMTRKGQSFTWCAGQYPDCTLLNFTIDFHGLNPDNIPEDGITLELGAPFGLLTTIEVKE